MRDFTTNTPTMKLTELIPYLKHIDKLNNLLSDLRIDINCEEVLIYSLDKLDIDSSIFLIELEKTKDKLEITLEGKKNVQLIPNSLAHELITIDLSNFGTDFEISQRLIE